MNLLLINSQPVTSLFGKAFPFEGFNCTVADTVPVAGFADAACIIDLSFEEHPDRISIYSASTVPVLIGSVVETLEDLGLSVNSPIARFNHWPYFVTRNCIEFATHPEQRTLFEQLFSKLALPHFAVADCAGFVSARTISMIVNEAYFAREQNVSTEAEIDTAMKLGTSYPMGPFEWCRAIGNRRILALLQKLAVTDARYQPSASFLQTTIS
jgi:3-hydroxybutyryl-CoA dehydrogenase